MKIVLIVFILLLFGNAYSENEGSGPIDFEANFAERFNQYLGHIKNNSFPQCEENGYVFAVHPEGANDWVCYGGWNALKNSEKKALNNCKKKAGNKDGCRIFSRGIKIVWEWEDMPEFNIYKEIVNPKDIKVVIGSGEIVLGELVQDEFNDYLEIYRNHIDDKTHHMFFAVTNDGTHSGDMGIYLNQNEVLEDILIKGSNGELSAKAAIAECMTKSDGKECYIFAVDDRIVWR